jgi:hypothetical protein
MSGRSTSVLDLDSINSVNQYFTGFSQALFHLLVALHFLALRVFHSA